MSSWYQIVWKEEAHNTYLWLAAGISITVILIVVAL
jgi:hypothetical protein